MLIQERYHNFRPQIKFLEKNLTILFANKIKTKTKNNLMYKNKMKLYCLKCRKDTENINPKVSKTSNNRTMIISKCAKCGSRKSRFIKNQEAKGLLSSLGIKTPLSKVPTSGNILF